MSRGKTVEAAAAPRPILWMYLAVAVLTAIYPVTRAFFRVEITYNEGWNIYNASTLAHHGLLYPAGYGWTSVNYPMLSFVIAVQLHRFTHDYLFTGRALCLLSFAGCCVLAGLIVRRVTGSRWAGWLAGAYCAAVLCAEVDTYIGQDDPQMLALVLFLAGLLLYVSRRESLSALVGVAALLVVAGSVKHDPVGFPLAVLVDLLLLSWRRAVWFTAWGLGFAAIAVWLNLHYGGSGFVEEMLTPRGFSWEKGFEQTGVILGPVLLPLCAAGYAAFRERRNERVRVLVLLLVAGVLTSVVFGSGSGVAFNAEFTMLLALAMLLGVFFAGLEQGRWERLGARVRLWTPAALLAWLIIPLIVWGTWNPVGRIEETIAAQQRLDQDVQVLRAASGPALCESLLRCYFAGKPYVYDPFNATRLIAFHELDDAVIVENLRQHRYGAVQLDEPLSEGYFDERFDARIAEAIAQSYAPVLVHKDSAIYLAR